MDFPEWWRRCPSPVASAMPWVSASAKKSGPLEKHKLKFATYSIQHVLLRTCSGILYAHGPVVRLPRSRQDHLKMCLRGLWRQQVRQVRGKRSDKMAFHDLVIWNRQTVVIVFSKFGSRESNPRAPLIIPFFVSLFVRVTGWCLSTKESAVSRQASWRRNLKISLRWSGCPQPLVKNLNTKRILARDVTRKLDDESQTWKSTSLEEEICTLCRGARYWTPSRRPRDFETRVPVAWQPPQPLQMDIKMTRAERHRL